MFCLQCWAPTTMSPQDSFSMYRYGFFKSPNVLLWICQSLAHVIPYQGFVCVLHPPHFWNLTYKPQEIFILLKTITVMQVDPTGKGSNLDKKNYFHQSLTWMLIFLPWIVFVLFMAACFALPLPSCSCTTNMFVLLCVQHKSIYTTHSVCYIKHRTLDLSFPLSPSWIRSTERSGILWLSSLKWWTEMPIQALKLCTGLHTFLWVSAVCYFKGGGCLFCIMCVHRALFLLHVCMGKQWPRLTIWSRLTTCQVTVYSSVFILNCQLLFNLV